MTSLAKHQSAQTTKMLIVGDSGSGKTGALASLASAGYNLRILDLDNGVDILHSVLSDTKYGYTDGSLARVEFETVTDSMRNVNGRLQPGQAKAWQRMAGLLAGWKTSDGQDLGSITTWTHREVLAVDSLSMATTAAQNFYQGLNARIGQKATWDDIYGTQQLLETFAQMLYDDAVKCQVIVLAHPDFIEDQSGVKRGYPATIGNKLSPKFGRYFNNVIEARTTGTGSSRTRKLLTKGSGLIEVKTSNPGKVKDEYSIQTGLAELFADLQGQGLVPTPPLAPPSAKT